jgi:hypothetical protein
MSKPRGRRRHSEFAALSAEEIAEIARNPSLPKALRKKAQAEEKVLKRRNRQKRQSHRGR